MATTLSAALQVQARITYDQSFTGLSNTENPTTFNKSISFATGTGAAQANQPYVTVLNLTASGTSTLNLTNASLLDPINNTISAVRVKGFLFWNMAAGDTLVDGTVGAAASSVTVAGLNGNAAAGGFIDGTTPKVRVQNGGWVGVGTPSSGGCTGGLTLTVTNEDSVNAAVFVVYILTANA